MHISLFANELSCQYCHKTHGTKEWPIHGDMVAFFYQKEPGNYTLQVRCPHCERDWYVVWDNDPGPVKPLGLSERKESYSVEFYESQMRQIAQQLIAKHGELLEVRCVSGNNPCHIELEFSDGNVIVVGDHSGEVDINLMKAGYHGTGAFCFYVFLNEARFNITEEQVGNMNNDTFLRRDPSSNSMSLTHDLQPVTWGTIGKVGEVLMCGETLIKSTGTGNLKPADVEKMKAEGDIDGLITALNDEDLYIHKLARDELCKIGDPRVVDPLLSAIGYGHGYYDKVNCRMPIVEGLIKVGIPAVEQLINALKSEDWRIRWTAVRALGEIDDARAVKPLISAIEDKRKGVRAIAAEALANIGDIRAVEPLKTAMAKEEHPGVKSDIMDALKKLEKKLEKLEKMGVKQDQLRCEKCSSPLDGREFFCYNCGTKVAR